MGDDQHGAAVVGEAAQQLHDVAVHARVEAGGRLVEEDQGGLGQQLQGDRDALALAAGEGGDLLLLVDVELQLAEDLVDPGLPLGLRGVRGEAELGRVLEGLLDGQLLVQDVVLRDQTDALPQLGELLVEVPVVVEDVALVGGAVAGERLEQRRLAGAGGADHRDDRLLRDAEGDVLEDLLAAVDGDREVAGGEGDLAGVDELLQPVPHQPEGRVADTDDVVRPDQRGARLRYRLAVEVRAVVRAEVAQLEPAVGRRGELRVQPRDLEVGDDQLVLQRTADPHLAAQGDLVERGRAAVAVDRPAALLLPALRRHLRLRRVALVGHLLLRLLVLLPLLLRVLLLGVRVLRVRRGRGLLLGRRGLSRPASRLLLRGRLLLCLRCGRLRGGAEVQARSVGGVAEIDGRAGTDLLLLDAAPFDEGAVGGAVVLDDPAAAPPADRRVPPGDPGVVECDIPLRITSEGVWPGRVERPGPSVHFQYEFRHSSPTELSPD